MRRLPVRLTVFCVISLLFLPAATFRARGDEQHLVACLTNLPAGFQVPSQIDPPAIFASRVMEQMTRPKTVEITVRYNNDGSVLDRKTNEIASQAAELPLWTNSQKQKVLETINGAISDGEFAALPLRRQQEILDTVATETRGIPERIEGQSLTDEDLGVKLSHLSLLLRRLKNIPVVSVENPELIAHQLSVLIDLLADDAIQRGGKAALQDPEIRNKTISLMEEEFTILARDTTTPCLKRPLPDVVFQEVKSTLQNSLKTGVVTNSSVPPQQTALEDNSTNQPPKADKRDNNIAEQLAHGEFMRSGKLVIDPYIGYPRTNDLKNVDFSGGLSDGEGRRDGKQMKAYIEREIEKTKASQKAQLAKFRLESVGRQSESSRLVKSRGKGRPAMVAGFVAANVALMILLIRLRKKTA